MRLFILEQIKADFMSETNNIPALLGEALLQAIRQAVRQEIQAASISAQANGNHPPTLLTVEELAQALKVPKSWVYACTRKKKDSIPHLRVGRYPRFELPKVLAWLESKKKN